MAKIPKFKSEKEEALFWEKHDLTEFEKELKPVKVEFPKPTKKLISLRLSPEQISSLKYVASKKSIGYLTLIRMWLSEKLNQELQTLRISEPRVIYSVNLPKKKHRKKSKGKKLWTKIDGEYWMTG